MADLFALPSVGDVHLAIAGLHHRRIAQFARVVGEVGFAWFLSAFKVGDMLPGLAVRRNSQPDHTAVLGQRVVDQQRSAIAQAHRINAAVRVGQAGLGQRSPGAALIAAPVLGDHLLSGANQALDAASAVPN